METLIRFNEQESYTVQLFMYLRIFSNYTVQNYRKRVGEMAHQIKVLAVNLHSIPGTHSDSSRFLKAVLTSIVYWDTYMSLSPCKHIHTHMGVCPPKINSWNFFLALFVITFLCLCVRLWIWVQSLARKGRPIPLRKSYRQCELPDWHGYWRLDSGSLKSSVCS